MVTVLGLNLEVKSLIWLYTQLLVLYSEISCSISKILLLCVTFFSESHRSLELFKKLIAVKGLKKKIFKIFSGNRIILFLKILFTWYKYMTKKHINIDAFISHSIHNAYIITILKTILELFGYGSSGQLSVFWSPSRWTVLPVEKVLLSVSEIAWLTFH